MIRVRARQRRRSLAYLIDPGAKSEKKITVAGVIRFIVGTAGCRGKKRGLCYFEEHRLPPFETDDVHRGIHASVAVEIDDRVSAFKENRTEKEKRDRGHGE